MSSVVISGDTSGSVTLQAPSVAGSTVLTLPTSNGTIIITAPGTSGNVLTSNGTSWLSQALPPGFDAGTRLAFQQTTAPTGWTKDTTAALDDSIMRIVTGSASSGGSTAFSTFNGQTTVGATTLAESQIPSHTHGVRYTGGTNAGLATDSQRGTTLSQSSGATGGGGSHNHSITTAIKYYDFIIASKN